LLVRVCEANNRPQGDPAGYGDGFASGKLHSCRMPDKQCLSLQTGKLSQQPIAALGHVAPGGIEIAGVPGIGHFLRPCKYNLCDLHDLLRNLFRRLGAGIDMNRMLITL
jgi:hypothetical protein